jgi:hypothetical protein
VVSTNTESCKDPICSTNGVNKGIQKNASRIWQEVFIEFTHSLKLHTLQNQGDKNPISKQNIQNNLDIWELNPYLCTPNF